MISRHDTNSESTLDPNVFLQEQLDKPPCRNFLAQGGYCEFGLLCKYSHITLDQATGKPHSKMQLQTLIINLGQPIYPPELIQWFHLQRQEATAENNKNVIITEKKKKQTRYRLPAGWKVNDLPPSLKPPPSKHGYDWNQVGSW
jgi:U11/U12 small nuclear ribonucleoprotein SNRNP20